MDSETPEADIVWEAKGIAKIIGQNERQTSNLLEKGFLPAKKIGGRWVASRKKLIEHLLN